jgi:hypothetical protein
MCFLTLFCFNFHYSFYVDSNFIIIHNIAIILVNI